MTRAHVPAIAGVICAVVAGCSLFSPQPTGLVRNGWVWPAPAPLPAGAVAVPLDVEPVPNVAEPNTEYAACPTALLGRVVIEHRPGQDPPIVYRAGHEVRVVWQAGFSARLNPTLEIVAPDGTVIAREGEPSRELGGGFFGGDRFRVCIGEYTPRRINPNP